MPWQRVSERKNVLRSLTIEKRFDLYDNKLHHDVEIYKKCHTNDQYNPDWITDDLQRIDSHRIFKVFTDHDLVRQYLTDEHFQLVDDPDQADIIFVMKHLQDFRQETLEKKLINQFPFENIITNKELLALVARKWQSYFK